MKVLWSAYYEFIRNIRDIRVLVALIAFPISIILILGTAFNDKLTEDFKEKIPVGYVILDNGEAGKSFVTLLGTSEVSKLLDVKSYKMESDAISDIDKGKIDNYIVIRENTTQKLQAGEKAIINLEGKKNIELVQTILEGYIAKSNAYSTAMNINQNSVSIEPTKYFERIEPLNNKLPKAIDYYSVLTLLQIIMLGSILGIFIINRDRDTNIHIRLYSLPISKWTIIYGRVLGSSLFLFVSCIVTVIFTKYVYNANWDGNLLLIGAALMAFSFLCIGIGIMIAAFTKNMLTAMGISFLMMFVTSSAGGTISPSVAIESLNIINPIYYAKVMLFGTLYNYPSQIMLKAAFGLLVLIVVVYMLSFLKLRRVNYDNI